MTTITKKKIRAAIRRKCACCLPFFLAGVVLWGEAFGAAGPRTLIVEGPNGERTVTNLDAKTSRTETCFSLITSGGATVHLTLSGRLAVSTDGRFAFTPAQLAEVRAALPGDDAAKDAELPGLLALEAPMVTAELADGPTPFLVGKVLVPDCGKCLSGKNCTSKGHAACCKSATDDSCMTCTNCPKAIVEAED